MKTAKLTTNLIFAALVLSPFVYLWMIWGSLPAEVPLHFGIDGEPDRWGSKNTLIFLPCILPLGTYLLMIAIPRIDPKNGVQKMGNKYNIILTVLVGFMTTISFLILNRIQGNGMSLVTILPALVGALLIILGNYMQSIKPNYFVGIRTPWTLESDIVWRKTHRLAGRLFMGGGILMVLVALTLKGFVMLITYLTIGLSIAFISIIYSYVAFKKLPE
jgi:uncharacterized membrane protein